MSHRIKGAGTTAEENHVFGGKMPAKSKSQRRLMGMAKGIQDGEIPASKSPAAAKVAETMNPGDLNEFASTREAGLPGKVKPNARVRPRPQERKPMRVRTSLKKTSF